RQPPLATEPMTNLPFFVSTSARSSWYQHQPPLSLNWTMSLDAMTALGSGRSPHAEALLPAAPPVPVLGAPAAPLRPPPEGAPPVDAFPPLPSDDAPPLPLGFEGEDCVHAPASNAKTDINRGVVFMGDPSGGLVSTDDGLEADHVS